ncbi:MAG: transglycosylase domain-containing protein [Ktedonobacteraceae bacterium]|nr:transglycosylase domain-containing protein [Ktedonobacteraceae bacterium]
MSTYPPEAGDSTRHPVRTTAKTATITQPQPTPTHKHELDTLLRRRHRRRILIHYLSRKRLRHSRHAAQRSVHRFWISITSTVMTLLILLITFTSTASYAAYRFYRDTQHQFASQILSLHDLTPRDNLKMYDSKGIMIGQLIDHGMHTTVTFDDIAPHLVNATVAIEDKNFWTNSGIDVNRIIQSALDDVRGGRVIAGGSTITQQLIKKLVVGDQTSIERKLQELALIPTVNDSYSKKDILEMYLNSIYYGEQAYGIDAAANLYFGLQDQPGRPASKQLNLAQSAMLAGIPNSPSAYDPWLRPQVALNRMQTVLDRMVSDGYITRAGEQDALKEAQQPHFLKRSPNLVNRAPHFFYFVLGQLKQIYHLSDAQLSRSDMSITTTLDVRLQDKIQKIMQQQVALLNNSGHRVTNAAEVLIDYHNGAIRSLLGSIDYNSKTIDGKYDVATQGYRQPGSSFKPYVYATAFEQGASPAQAILDAPLTISIPGGNPPTYSPANYDQRYHGHMTLRCALQNSLNIPAVKVLQHVGIDAAMQTARDMGITSYNGVPGYSLVLGGLGVHLLDHTSAYGAFANGGVRVPYYTVESVTFMHTHQTYTHQPDPGQPVISPQIAYMMTNVLSDNTSRLPEFFDCNPLQLYSNSEQDCWRGNRGQVRPAAAKTGTTNDFKDNWTIGYTTDYVMGVWAGNNNGLPMINVTGVQGAAPIWHDAMLLAEQGHPIRDFQDPGGLVRATVTYPDGIQATDLFLPGTIPTFMPPINQPPQDDLFPFPDDDPPPPDNPQPLPHPYCPNAYSFVAPPPGSNTKPSGWW